MNALKFLIIITVKERTDYKDIAIDKFAIYDLYSETTANKKPFDSSSTTSVGYNPMTICSRCQTDTYNIHNLINLIKYNPDKTYNKELL